MANRQTKRQAIHDDALHSAVQDRSERDRQDANDGSSRLVSPATDLRYQIETAYNPAKESDHKWSTRQTFLFLIGVCGLFWALVIFLGLSIF